MNNISNIFKFKYNGYDLHFSYLECKFNPECVTIFLHGWQRNKEDFSTLLVDSSIALDNLNFGSSSKTKEFSLMDYVNCLRIFVNEKKIEKLNLVGHSFGGRIAILYATLHPVNKLILVSAAGIVKRDITYYLKIIRYKVLKRINKVFKVKSLHKYTSKEYLNLDNSMKKTYINIVNKNLTKYLNKIKCETLIINGINDQTIKYSNAIIMHKKIKNSRLVCFFNSSHFPYITEHTKFKRLLIEFLKEDKHDFKRIPKSDI